MKLFSQRQGIKLVKNIIQIDDMDADLRNRLWDALSFFYWNQVADWRVSFRWSEMHVNMKKFVTMIWHNLFKIPIDTINYDVWSETYKIIRKHYFNCNWHEIYDFIEFTANNYPDESKNLQFMEFCNSILKEELSAYRFVGGKIIRITKEEEIAEIEEALSVPISPVQQHINRAIELISDRKKPDYRNSIKESISAVEAICKLIANNNNATLGQALNAIEKGNKAKIHPALGGAFSKLYGYTNDASGIRHALMEESDLDFDDAKFMLVSCSGFINYLVSKSSKAGIKL